MTLTAPPPRPSTGSGSCSPAGCMGVVERSGCSAACSPAPCWCSRDVSSAARTSSTAPAPVAAPSRRGPLWLLPCLAAASAFAVWSARPTSTAANIESTAVPAAAVVPAAADAGEPQATCVASNRSFAVGSVIHAPPLASGCRPCTCTPQGEWQCCLVRPAAHSVARGTERYAETLAFVAAWMHLKLEGVPAGRTYRDNTLMQ